MSSGIMKEESSASNSAAEASDDMNSASEEGRSIIMNGDEKIIEHVEHDIEKAMDDDQSSGVNDKTDSPAAIYDVNIEDQGEETAVENDNNEYPSNEEEKKHAEPILLDMDGTQLDTNRDNGQEKDTSTDQLLGGEGDKSSDDKVTTEEGKKKGHNIIILPNFAGDPIIDYPPTNLSKEKIEKMIANIDGGKEEGEKSADQIDASESDDAAETEKDSSCDSDISAIEDGDSDQTAESIETDSERSATVDSKESKEDLPSEENDDNSTDSITAASDDDEEEEEQPKQIKLVDYASKMAGAQILEQSPSLKGASNLLTSDNDKYSISPCEDKKYIVIGLSEDILVKQIKLSNYERYSSRVQDFQVLSSQEYPTPNEEYWTNIGTYTAHSKSGEQSFDLDEPSWARYLKFRFISHYGSEHYCTLSQIKVHGSTMLQGFHEQWIESEKDVVSNGVVNELETEEQEEQEEVEVDVDNEKDEDEGESVVDEEVDSDISPQVDKEGEEKMHIEEEEEQHDQQRIEIKETEGEDKNVGVESENVEESQSDTQTEETKTPDSRHQENNVEADEVEQTEIKAEDKMDAKDDDVQVDNPVETETEVGEEEEAEDAGEEVASDFVVPLVGGDEIDEQIPVADSERSDQEASIETEEPQAKDDETDNEDSSTSEPLDEELTHDIEEEDSQNASQNKDDEIITNEENTVQDNSSIGAVTDVVKAVVVDASGVIKNATSDAIKAIRTTVGAESEDTAESDKKAENTTLGGESSGDGNIQEEGKEQEEIKAQSSHTAKQDNIPPIEDTSNSQVDTPKTPSQLKGDISNDNTKPNASDGSVKTDTNATSAAKPEMGKPAHEESPKATSTSRDLLRRGTITHTSKDSRELYAKLSDRFPHAACIKDLDFQAFKSKTMLANAERSGGSAMGGGPGKMEPIFAKITNEIKNVQITQNQYEQYLSALKTCYESLFYDMAKDLDSTQADVNHRLASLERAVFLSEMNTKGGRRNNATSSATNDVTSRTNLPFTMSAFQLCVPIYVMPTLQEHAQETGIVLGTLVLLAMLLLRGKKNMARATKNDTSASSKSTVLCTPERSSTDSSLLENKLDETKRKLADTDEKFNSLHGKYATLQSEHTSLQQRYSLLVATLENEAAEHPPPQREVHHVIPSEAEDGYSTPTSPIQGRKSSTEELPKKKKNSQCPSTIS